MARTITQKQKTFADAYIENGGNGTQAALVAYETESKDTARAIASENLIKPNVVNYLEAALPDDLLAEVHREGLFATKTVFDKDGNVLAEDADFNARAKYLDMAYKILGKYAPEKSVRVNIDQLKPSQKLIDLADKLNS